MTIRRVLFYDLGRVWRSLRQGRLSLPSRFLELARAAGGRAPRRKQHSPPIRTQGVGCLQRGWVPGGGPGARPDGSGSSWPVALSLVSFNVIVEDAKRSVSKSVARGSFTQSDALRLSDGLSDLSAPSSWRPRLADGPEGKFIPSAFARGACAVVAVSLGMAARVYGGKSRGRSGCRSATCSRGF